MKVITGGCSFTYNEGSWAHHIPNVINVARGGSGPITSVREVLVKLRETSGDKICIFQVSNPVRTVYYTHLTMTTRELV